MRNARIVPVALSLCLAAVLTSCGGESDSGENSQGRNSQEKVTLSFLAVASSQPAIEQMVTEFQRANPDVQVDATYVPGRQRDQILLTQLASGNAPDLFIAAPGNVGPASVSQIGGRMLDLSGSPWVEQIPDQERPVNTYNGKLVTYPGLVTAAGVIYNKTLFEESGWPIPTTTAELLSLCRQISAEGKTPMVVPGADALAASTLLSASHSYIFERTPNWLALRDKGEVSFASSPDWRASLQSLIDMKDAGCFSPDAAGTTLAAAYQQIADGSAAMLTVTTALLGPILEVNPSANLAFFPFPGPTAADRHIATASPFNIGINAETTHAEEAKAFINFLAENVAQVAELTGGVTYDDVAESDLPERFSLLAPLFEEGNFEPFWPISAPNASLYPYSGTAMQGLLTGQLSVAQILGKYDHLWDNPKAAP